LFIPFDDDQPKNYAFSPATTAIVFLNIAILALCIWSDNPRAIFDRFAFDPKSPGPITAITCQFLHAGIGHLVGNIIFFWVVGRPLEFRLGVPRFLAAYLGGGVLAAIAHAFASSVPVVGASGAIAALMGIYAVLCFEGQIRCFYWFGIFWWGVTELAAMWLLLFWFVGQVIMTLVGSSEVAYAAHLGGFLAGFGAALAFRNVTGVVPAKKLDPSRAQAAAKVGSWKTTRARAFTPDPGRARREDAQFEAEERAKARVEIRKALGAGDELRAIQVYESSALLGMRPVFDAVSQRRLASFLTARGRADLGRLALADLPRETARA
jgi:membrane associated rhomboid family serine protease